MSDHSMLVEFTVYDAGGFCRDLPALLAMARAGAAAWEHVPHSGVVDQALRPRKVAEVLAMCDELEDAFERAVADVRRAWKQERRDARRADRERASA